MPISSAEILRPTFQDIRALCRFPKPHQDMFLLAKTVPYWLQLLRSSPVLAFMVARCWHFDGQPQDGAWARIHRYVRLKRSAICGEMGFPSDPRSLRLILRVQMSKERLIGNLLLLRALLHWEPATRDILNRGGFITSHQLSRLASGDRWHEWPCSESLQRLTWFFKLPAARRYWLADRFLSASSPSELAKAFLRPAKELWRFRNERQAVAYFVDLDRRRSAIWKAEEILKRSDLPWPDPPIQPTAKILPVLSLKALQKEGKEMRHCVATYTPKIFLGDYYVYRVSGSTPCTLGIRYADGSWKIDQLKGPLNAPPPDEGIFQMINDWLLSAPPKCRYSSARGEYLAAISKLSGLQLLERRK